jgi:hypothetical protein
VINPAFRALVFAVDGYSKVFHALWSLASLALESIRPKLREMQKSLFSVVAHAWRTDLLSTDSELALSQKSNPEVGTFINA